MLCHIWAETPTNCSSHVNLGSWEWQPSEMGFEEQAEKLVSPTEQQAVKGPEWTMLTRGLIFAFLHYITAETLKYGRINKRKWGSTGETGKQKLERTKIVGEKIEKQGNGNCLLYLLYLHGNCLPCKREKVIRRELNFSFPEVPQTQSLNTTKTISFECMGRTRDPKTVYLVKRRRTCSPGYTPLHSRYLTEEPQCEALLQLCLYVLHGGRKEALDQKSGLGSKMGLPFTSHRSLSLRMDPARSVLVFYLIQIWVYVLLLDKVILGLPLLHYLTDWFLAVWWDREVKWILIVRDYCKLFIQ